MFPRNLSGKGRFLVIAHTYRQDESIIRIISARKANRLERRLYEEREQP